MRKLSYFLAALLAALYLGGCVTAYAAYTPNFEIQSEAVYLVNLNTGDVIYEKNADKRMYPASLTKLMTCILAFEMIDDLEGTEITAKSYLYDELYLNNASTGDIRQGETMSARLLIYAMLMQSAGEAASIIADYLGDGSLDYFAEMMTERAKELGCTNTNFTNPHGLFNENNYTTAKDMFLIAKHAVEIPGLLDIACTTHYEVPPTNIHNDVTYRLVWNTTNKMMVQGTSYYYEPVRGLKTGTLEESGKCFVSTATLNGYDYLCVILGAPFVEDENGYEIDNISFKETKALYQWAFNSFSIKPLLEKGTDMTEIPVKLAKGTDHIKLASAERFTALVPDEIEQSSVVKEYDLPEYMIAPVKKGDQIGTVKLILAGKQIGEIPLVATANAERSQMLYLLDQAENITYSFWFKFGMIFVITFTGLYVLVMVIRNRNMRRRQSSFRPRRK